MVLHSPFCRRINALILSAHWFDVGALKGHGVHVPEFRVDFAGEGFDAFMVGIR